MDDELLDVVDRNDKVIGTINRKDYKTLVDKKLGYIRFVELFILNSKGQIYCPIRTGNKTIAPNGYDYGAAGHVSSGDDYSSTLIKETREELNLTISLDEVEFIDKIISDDVRTIRNVYLLRTDQTPVFNPKDYVSAEWLTPSELIQRIDDGHLAKTDLKETVTRLQEYLRNLN